MNANGSEMFVKILEQRNKILEVLVHKVSSEKAPRVNTEFIIESQAENIIEFVLNLEIMMKT